MPLGFALPEVRRLPSPHQYHPRSYRADNPEVTGKRLTYRLMIRGLVSLDRAYNQA